MLSERDQLQFTQALLNPTKPNGALSKSIGKT